jgi:hypothetical protein
VLCIYRGLPDASTVSRRGMPGRGSFGPQPTEPEDSRTWRRTDKRPWRQQGSRSLRNARIPTTIDTRANDFGYDRVVGLSVPRAVPALPAGLWPDRHLGTCSARTPLGVAYGYRARVAGGGSQLPHRAARRCFRPVSRPLASRGRNRARPSAIGLRISRDSADREAGIEGYDDG